MKKQRNIQIEIIRILAMFMIVLGHVFLYGHVAENVQNSMMTREIITAIKVFATPGTDIFVLISGYFLLNSKMSVKRITILWLQILFYSVSLYLFMTVLGTNTFSCKGLVMAFFPIAFNQYWFMRVYFYLVLCAPFLNRLLNSLNQEAHKYLILLGIILMVIPASIPGIALFNSEAGNGILWFMMLYSTGAYFSKYPPRYSARRYIIMAFICFMVAFLSKEGISWLSTFLGFAGKGESRFCTFDAFPIYVESCCLICVGIKMKLKIRHNCFVEKAILFLSESTAGVYMIHEHPLVRSIIWRWLNSGNHMIVYAIFIAVFVFVACSMIDQVTWKKILRYLRKIDTEKLDALFALKFKGSNE